MRARAPRRLLALAGLALATTALQVVATAAPAQAAGCQEETMLGTCDDVTPPDTTLISSPFVDIALLARYGAVADAATHAPEAAYIRDADAKPQTAGRVQRSGA